MADKTNPQDLPNYDPFKNDSPLPAMWVYVDTILAGTWAMRADGNMLPSFPSEHEDVYDDRREAATFDNEYKETLEGIVGIIYRRPMALGDDVPQQIKEAAEDIDLQGSHLDIFAPRFVRKSVHYGAGYILIDQPRVPNTGRELDAAEARALNIRPYWVAYGASDVVGRPRYVPINGKQTLEQIVFCEYISVPDGRFGQALKTRYRVWNLPVMSVTSQTYIRIGPPGWEIWEEVLKDDKSIELVMIESGAAPQLTRIPVSPLITTPNIDKPNLTDGPMLMDLAYLVVKDFQQTSDHEANLHLCNSPVPYTTGLRDAEVLTKVPWGKGVKFDLELGGTCGYAEPKGDALQAMERQLLLNKKKIRQKGLELVLNEDLGSIETTAFEQHIRAGKRLSRLSELCAAVHDCFELALSMHAEWLGKGVDGGGTITMGLRPDQLFLTANDITALSTAREKGVTSIRAVLNIFKRAELLGEDQTAESVMAEMIDEQNLGLGPVQKATTSDVNSGAA